MQSHACLRSQCVRRCLRGRLWGGEAQLQLGVKRGHQREELRQLLVGAGPEVVDHAGQARGEDVHAIHEPHAQGLGAALALPLGAAFGAALAMGMGLSGSLPLPS